jgi:predicted aminopeptidase
VSPGAAAAGWRAWPRAPLAVLALAVLLAGCDATPGYLVRAGWAEAQLLWRRRPIAGLLAEPDLDPGLRERLELTLAVRDYARDLGLHVGDAYTTFAEVPGDATVWVVSAARRDRLEAVEWRYPLVGRLPYRGFFERADADAVADRLAANALDVEVRPAIAFSTLGWFADPLLSTATAEPPVVVADTVLHELWHATLFLPGEATFNESTATFAGHRGAIAFFCSGPGRAPASCAEARARWSATRARGRVLGRLAARLRVVYAAEPPPVERERRRAALGRAAAAALTRRGLGGTADVVPPNNARLLGDLVYLTDLDALDALAPQDADLGPALARLAAAARDSDDPFAALAVLASGREGR